MQYKKVIPIVKHNPCKYDIENDTKNITFIDEIIFYPLLSIKNTILNVN
jgi:hypothetical protein